MLARLCTSTLFIAATVITPAYAQIGGGGQGGADSPGITLGDSGAGSSESKTKDDKKNATERPIKGMVTDASGKPIAGALVQLKNTHTLEVRSLVTSAKGDYYFAGLAKDVDYQVKAVFKDHSSPPHTLSEFDIRAQPVVNLQIR